MEKLQRKGNNYIYSDSFLRPEKVVNYLSRDAAGLGSIHVKSKCTALFIKNLLCEALSGDNCYLNAVIRKYCDGEDLTPAPVKPPYLTNSMVENIKLVRNHIDGGKLLSTKCIYKVLLENEFSIYEDFKLRIEAEHPGVNLQKASLALNFKLVSLPARSNLFRCFHKLLYLEPEESKIKNRVAVCRLCDEQYITRNHIYFKCSKLYGIGRDFMKILRVLDPDYTEEEVLYLTVMDRSLPQASWLIANTMYFIVNNRERCNIQNYKAFLKGELEVLERSQQADVDIVFSIKAIVECVGNLDEF